MKRVVVMVTVLCFFGAAVFAESSPFDVEGTPVSQDQQAQVEGGVAPVVVLLAAVGVCAAGSIGAYVVSTKLSGGQVTAGGVIASGLSGAVQGASACIGVAGSVAVGAASAGAFYGRLALGAVGSVVSGAAISIASKFHF